jgi:hypothetical protein
MTFQPKINETYRLIDIAENLYRQKPKYPILTSFIGSDSESVVMEVCKNYNCLRRKLCKLVDLNTDCLSGDYFWDVLTIESGQDPVDIVYVFLECDELNDELHQIIGDKKEITEMLEIFQKIKYSQELISEKRVVHKTDAESSDTNYDSVFKPVRGKEYSIKDIGTILLSQNLKCPISIQVIEYFQDSDIQILENANIAINKLYQQIDFNTDDTVEFNIDDDVNATIIIDESTLELSVLGCSSVMIDILADYYKFKIGKEYDGQIKLPINKEELFKIISSHKKQINKQNKTKLLNNFK